MPRKPRDESDKDELTKYEGDEGLAARWLKEIQTVRDSSDQKKFEAEGDKIIKAYRNHSPLADSTGSGTTTRVMFNVLWLTVQVLKPSLFSRIPKPVVERYFKDRDPIGRLACTGAERAVSYSIRSDQERFVYAIKAAVEDRLLPGRGQVWPRFDCEWDEAKDAEGQPILNNGVAVRTPKPNSERVIIDPLNWLDYLESGARNQYEMRWRAKRVYMTRSKLVTRFGEAKGKACVLTYDPNDAGKKGSREDTAEFLKQAEVWEIQDEDTKCTYWVSEGYKHGPLDVQPDRLGLKGFYSCPIPLLATTTTDNQYPVADFKIYERLAEELDYITKRISGLAECVRLVGLHAESLSKEIKKLTTLKDGETWPLKNFQQFISEKGGLAAAINWFPFERAVEALQPLMQYQQSLLQQIYEIVGIPDIVRGATDPNEPLGTQLEKVRWVGIKAEEKAADVERFCREIVGKMAEMIFEPGLFSDETINLMVGYQQMSPEEQQNWPAALALLRDDRLRTFRVDVETASTVAMDEAREQESRMKWMSAVNQLVANIQSVEEYRPELKKPMFESAIFAINAFRSGREVAGSFESALDQIQDNDKAKAEAAAQQPPPPDYEAMKAQTEAARAQTEAAKIPILQAELQLKQQECGYKFQLDQQKIAQEGQAKLMELDIKAQSVQNEALTLQSKMQIDQIDQELKQFKDQFEAHAEAARIEIEKFKAQALAQEKLIEERRLAVDTHHEGIRLAHERERLRIDEKEIDKPAPKPA